MNSAELLRFFIETLREYDIRNVSKKQIARLAENRNAVGLTVFQPINFKKIYISRDIMPACYQTTILHELSHVYYYNIGNPDVSEEVVEALADKWHRVVYGLEERL